MTNPNRPTTEEQAAIFSFLGRLLSNSRLGVAVRGQKTNIIGGLMVVHALLQVFGVTPPPPVVATGEPTFAQPAVPAPAPVDPTQELLTGAGLMALRAGVRKAENANGNGQ